MFLSWIELTSGDKRRYLYLTDNEVFGAVGNKLFPNCRDVPITTHGAIRWYYSTPSDRGRECWERQFWNLPILPAEIRCLVTSTTVFAQHFGRMFASGCFSNDDLSHIACNAPAPWSQMAFTQLLAQEPSANDLVYVACFGSDVVKAQAAERCLARSLTDENLRYLAQLSPAPWRDQAKKIMGFV